jgi:hypothetical protein
MNKLVIYCGLLIGICFMLSSCSESKRILKRDYAFKYVDNESRRSDTTDLSDKFYIYKIKKPFKTEIIDKTDYFILENVGSAEKSSKIDSVKVSRPIPEKIKMDGVIYSTDSIKILHNYQKPFRYLDLKFSVQTLTIPLKFRKALGDGIKYPSQAESSVNIGFATSMEYSINRFDPYKKRMGKSLNQISFNPGTIYNFGATALDPATNSPGLKSNRNSPMFTLGTFLMVGINNIYFGYGIGWDWVIGEGHSYWVYQHKMWHGIIIALNVFKP